MSKEIYKIRQGREGGGVIVGGEHYLLTNELSQSNLKKLFKAKVKSIVCEQSEEKETKKPKGKEA